LNEADGRPGEPFFARQVQAVEVTGGREEHPVFPTHAGRGGDTPGEEGGGGEVVKGISRGVAADGHEAQAGPTVFFAAGSGDFGGGV